MHTDPDQRRARDGRRSAPDPSCGAAEVPPEPKNEAPDAPDAADVPPARPSRVPLRGKIPVEDRATYEHMAREAMAAYLWVQRQRAAGRLPN